MIDFGMDSPELEEYRAEVIEKASGTVLEIGAGSGRNLLLYGDISKLYALEPSAELMRMARERAKALRFPVEFLLASAERIPLPDASVDTVVSTWTLCSVGKPQQVLQEVVRVLRKGGRFIFMDHGVSPRPVFLALQNFLTPITKHFMGNCHLNRDIHKLIRDSGLILEMSEQVSLRWKPLMCNTKGVATKSS